VKKQTIFKIIINLNHFKIFKRALYAILDFAVLDLITIYYII